MHMREHCGYFGALPFGDGIGTARRARGAPLAQMKRVAATHGRILTLNAGSSSVKVAVYVRGGDLTCALKGHLSAIGTSSITW
jgi:hypothetical protein